MGVDQSDLQFDQAEYAEPAGGPPVCQACRQPLADTYFTINAHVVCPTCRVGVVESLTSGPMAPRLFRAGIYGLLAAAVGSGIYYGVRAGTGFEFGLIAIVVGYMVGMAVRHGSGARGGWVFQTMAVVLTYLAIVSTYFPDIIRYAREQRQQTATAPSAGQTTGEAASAGATATAAAKPARKKRTFKGFVLALIALFVIACLLPFFGGASNLIGLLIIFFGLHEAWRLNKRPVLTVTGPHAVGAPAEAADGG